MNLNKLLAEAKNSSAQLLLTNADTINEGLKKLAIKLVEHTNQLLAENEKDLKNLENGTALRDRILLTPERISALAKSLTHLAEMKSPINDLIEEKVLENGLNLKRVVVPLGLVGAIFEARPNVVVDIFALCFKTQNACVLKGGSDCEKSNECLVDIIKSVLSEYDLQDAITLLPNDRAVVADFLKANEFVDVIIPRGGKALIDFVRANATVPVIETGAGVVHTYFDESGDLQMGADIVYNAKVSRPAVCNSLDTLLIHQSRVPDAPELCKKLADQKVKIFADKTAFEVLKNHYPRELLSMADDTHFGMEFLSLQLAIKTVSNLDEAIEHINKFGSRHSETIITENQNHADEFIKKIDAACVYQNASTRFTDGGEFGLGAEVGISTQKLHARGPMGLSALTTYKWIIKGNGQIRS